MMVLLDSPHSKPPFVLRKLKVKALLKPVSGSRSNYNFSLKLIVTTIMFQFQPSQSEKEKETGAGGRGRMTLSSIHGQGCGAFFSPQGRWRGYSDQSPQLQTPFLESLPRMQTEMVVFQARAAGDPAS